MRRIANGDELGNMLIDQTNMKTKIGLKTMKLREKLMGLYKSITQYMRGVVEKWQK